MQVLHTCSVVMKVRRAVTVAVCEFCILSNSVLQNHHDPILRCEFTTFHCVM